MKKILTISIAAYHVEKYLSECLESFTAPDLADSLEVLIINDGSGEGVNTIARTFVEKYPSVFRLIDKENGGHGSTVNRGIEEASATYFKTVDGDDQVHPEGLRELITFLKKTTADLIVTNYQCFDDTSGHILQEEKNSFAKKQFRKIYSFDEIADKIYINMHAATFRTSLLKEMKERLDEHCFYVDAEYILYPIPHIKTAAFLEQTVYMYRLGMTTQSMDILNMQKNCHHHETVLKHLLEFYTDCCHSNYVSISSAKKRYIEKGIARIATSQIKIYLSYPPNQKRKEQIQELETYLKKSHYNIYCCMTNFAVKILRFSKYHLYKFASFACRKAYHCSKTQERN